MSGKSNILNENAIYSFINDGGYMAMQAKQRKKKHYIGTVNNEETIRRLRMASDKDLKESLIDYRTIFNGFSFDDRLSLMLNEGIFSTYSVDDTITYIRRHFKIPNLFIEKIYGADKTERIQVIIPTMGDNYETLKRAFNLCGYYRAVPSCEDKDIPKNAYVLMQFEPLRRKPSTDVLKGETTLIHVTRAERAESIRRKGFVPHSKNKAFAYPERIYFVKGSFESVLDKIARMLLSAEEFALYNSGGHIDREFAYIFVDVGKLPPQVQFHTDSNFNGGFYTEDYIPPEVISDIKFQKIVLN